MKRSNGLLLAMVIMLTLILATAFVAVNIDSDNNDDKVERNEE